MDDETWSDIKGYEGVYKISTHGNVRSFTSHKNGEQLKPASDKFIYKWVNLSKNGEHKKHLIHRLVASAFIENKHGFEQVNHIDGNKLNNHVENLEWCTKSQNMKHAFKIGLQSLAGEKHPQSKLTDSEVIEISHLLKTTTLQQKEIAKLFNIDKTIISKIKHKKIRKHIL